jgi:hypothetical protein
MSSSSNLIIFGPSAGHHRARINTLRFLFPLASQFYFFPKVYAAFKESLNTPWHQNTPLWNQDTFQSRLVNAYQSGFKSSTRIPFQLPLGWPRYMHHAQIPKDLLTLGPFKFCFDDQLIGHPNTLLIHVGDELGFHFKPSAFCFRKGGGIHYAHFEWNPEDNVLTFSAYEEGHHLIGGPWTFPLKPISFD